MKFYRILQALSLDVVLGINIFAIAIERYYNTFSSWHVHLGLSIAIWLIYTVDHLLDARKIKGVPSTYRHQFHKEHRRPLIMISILVFIAGLINLFYLPLIILFSGLLLALVTGIYFLLLQKTFFWAKEIFVGSIYTFGLFIGPLAFSYPRLNVSQWLLMPQALMIAYANLLLFSWFDVLMDKQDGHRSMTIHWGKPGAEKIIKLLLSVGILAGGAIAILNPELKTLVMQLVIILMNILLAFVFRYNRIFRRNEMYRVVGDGIFYLPLIYIYIFYAG